ncbi:hypothetical protein WHZ78_17575 [Bradyrhizobium symbiodeficiens]|uniref:hypothetical protein n=1 Tax=Bradyrhizobium symbiodeficiens TaxID=1404367 RepID=UPI0030D27EF3
MTRGLLDALSDPDLMAQVEERRRLVRKVAERFGWSEDEARHALDAQDALAFEAAQLRLEAPDVPAENIYH